MSIFDNARELLSLVQKLDNVELINKTLSLQQQLQDLLDENGQLKDARRRIEAENDELKTQVAQWEERLRQAETQPPAAQDLFFNHNAYWRQGASGPEGALLLSLS